MTLNPSHCHTRTRSKETPEVLLMPIATHVAVSKSLHKADELIFFGVSQPQIADAVYRASQRPCRDLFQKVYSGSGEHALAQRGYYGTPYGGGPQYGDGGGPFNAS